LNVRKIGIAVLYRIVDAGSLGRVWRHDRPMQLEMIGELPPRLQGPIASMKN
jgi:hypothetical protein